MCQQAANHASGLNQRRPGLQLRMHSYVQADLLGVLEQVACPDLNGRCQKAQRVQGQLMGGLRLALLPPVQAAEAP